MSGEMREDWEAGEEEEKRRRGRGWEDEKEGITGIGIRMIIIRLKGI